MVGENEYGHPHARTLNTFKRLTIPVFRTDELGDITIVSDGSVMRRSGK
jgi:beta-lactamase superfamily II metal-dependent hydrolase